MNFTCRHCNATITGYKPERARSAMKRSPAPEQVTCTAPGVTASPKAPTVAAASLQSR